jgi:SAM-dependent methyltransferase
MKTRDLNPTREELEEVFRLKYGDPRTTGWGPRTRHRFGYFTPDDFYEAVVAKLIYEGCSWIDVGSGRDLFPSNKPLARTLSTRCKILVGVDPSDNIADNPFVHQRVRSSIEQFRSKLKFDVATLRMVAEHIATPELAITSLSHLLRPGGKVVVYTVNRWAPVSVISLVTPFWLHHPAKRILWGSEEKDTFPVVYKMNTRRRLATLFQGGGFKECYFAYLDDCRTFASSRLLSRVEFLSWRMLHSLGSRYPENCLLGIYERL